MKVLQRLLLLILFSISLNANLFSQGANCSSADPFCTGSVATFPAGVGVTDAMVSEPGNNYGCLGSAPNPAWYYMEINNGGNMTIDITNTNNLDIDFALWGPFNDYTTAMGNCGSLGAPYDCSYSGTANPEVVTITGATTGEVYILLITNFSNSATDVSFTNSSGTATTNCSIVNPCIISALSVNPTACNPATNTYNVSGSIAFTDPPTSGTLTVTDCHGNNQVFNAPFTSPINYNLNGITADGAPCDVTATFSADPACTFTTNYNAPAACNPCNISALSVNATACNPATNTYDVSGTITFANAPGGGTLTVTDCHGNNQVFNAPFTSPINYNINGITADGAPCDVTATFSADPTCTFTTNYNAPTSCTVPCVMDSMPIVMTNCYSTPFLGYDVSGNLYFNNPPTTGTLTITPCSGAPIVFNAPFTSPQAFNFAGLPQNGSNCAFTAVFSADPTCTITTNFLSPPPITGFTLNQNNCVNDTFQLSGTVSFSNPPATGTLTVSYNDGVNTIDTIINAPFNSPENWSLAAPANSNNYTITVYFSGYPTCAVTYTGTAEPPCNCLADVGTFSTSITPNNGQDPYKLCFGDQFTMSSNGDFVPPGNIGNAPPNYNPSIGYLVYSCPPTIAVNPSNTPPNDNIANDPCFVGVVGFGNSFNDINTLGQPSYAGPWSNNTMYFVPITFYDTISGTYSYVMAGNLPCYEMGPAFAVQYLTQITTAAVEDCQDSSVTVTVTGGLPEFDGSLYTASNLQPANASFVNNTCTHNGTIVINGLLDGDMYSFDIVDTNGCPVTVTGGPFVGLPNAYAGVDDTSCTLSYVLNPTASFGTGTWTGPAGVNFAPNANTPNATVTVPAAGTYTFTWTEDNGGGCTSSDDVDIRFNILSIPNTPTNPTCNGGNDGQIVLAPQGGTAPYSYQWDAAAGNQTTNPATGLGAGSYMVTVTDAFGCFVDSTFTLTEPTPFTYTTDAQNANCGNPDGWAAVINFAGGTPGYTYDWGAGPTNNDTLFNLTPNSYSVTVADANNCDTTFSITVGNNPSFTASITGSTNVSCNGLADGDATADGSDPTATYNFSWNTVPSQNTQTATGLAAGTYIVTVTDVATGCTDTASITITEPPVLTVNAGNDLTICNGASTNISANGNGGTPGYSYNWDNGLGNGQNQNVSPTTTTTYTVTITDANNCTNTDNVTVTVTPPLSVIASADVTICPGGQANISAAAAGGNGGPYNYNWSNGIGNGQNQTVSPASTTTYVVTASDGCTSPDANDSVTVFVSPLPTVAFLADTLSLCETPLQPIEFYNISPSPSYNEIWTFGDGSNGAGDTVTHMYNAPGSYDVSLTITDSVTGCTNSASQLGYINIYPNPTADFTITPQPATMFDPTLYFYDQSYTNITNWFWDIAGLDTSILPNPSYTFPEDTGNYLITLTVIDANGCTNSITKTAIVMGEYGIYIPNAFTPDFDNLNEGFFPSGFGISDFNYGFYIFDRWGEIIFESHQKFEPWDGTYKGKLVQNGVYVWKLEFKDINGENHSKVGHVNVIR